MTTNEAVKKTDYKSKRECAFAHPQSLSNDHQQFICLSMARYKLQARIEALRKEAARTRDFVAGTQSRLNHKGKELKTNVCDPESAKMATSKGVIQGYAAQATVDSNGIRLEFLFGSSTKPDL